MNYLCTVKVKAIYNRKKICLNSVCDIYLGFYFPRDVSGYNVFVLVKMPFFSIGTSNNTTKKVKVNIQIQRSRIRFIKVGSHLKGHYMVEGSVVCLFVFCSFF